MITFEQIITYGTHYPTDELLQEADANLYDAKDDCNTPQETQMIQTLREYLYEYEDTQDPALLDLVEARLLERIGSELIAVVLIREQRKTHHKQT